MGNEPITKDPPKHTDTITEKVTTPPLDPVTNRRNRENVVTLIGVITSVISLGGFIALSVLVQNDPYKFLPLALVGAIVTFSLGVALSGWGMKAANKKLGEYKWEYSPYLYSQEEYGWNTISVIGFQIKPTQTREGNPLAPWISNQDGNLVMDVQNGDYGEGTLVIHPADISETTFDLLDGAEPELVGCTSPWRYNTRSIYWHLRLPGNYHKHYAAAFEERAKAGKDLFKGEVTSTDKPLSYKEDIRPYILNAPKSRLAHRLNFDVTLSEESPISVVLATFGGVALAIAAMCFTSGGVGAGAVASAFALLCVFLMVGLLGLSADRAKSSRGTTLEDYAEMWNESVMGLPKNFKEELKYRSRSIILPLIPFGEDGSKYEDWIQSRPGLDADGKAKNIVGVYLPRGEHGIIELPDSASIKYESLDYPTGAPWVSLEANYDSEAPRSATIHLPSSVLE